MYTDPGNLVFLGFLFATNVLERGEKCLDLFSLQQVCNTFAIKISVICRDIFQ